MFSRIRKLSYKIVFFNTVTAAILVFSLTLSIALTLNVSNIREEVRELQEVSSSILHRTEGMSFDEIVEKYDTLIDEDKSEITLYLKNGDRDRIFGHLDLENLKFLDKRSGWNLEKDFSNYYLKFTVGEKEYLFIRYFETEKIAKQFLVIILMDILVVALVFIVSVFGAKFILTPVSDVIKAAKNINARNLDARLPVNTDDEIGELAGVLNNTFDRLKNAFYIQKRFSQDASHELKTSISVMKGYLDILDWGRDDPDLLEEAVTNIREEVENMQELVENLFFLARTESLKLNYAIVSVKEMFSKLQRDYSITGVKRIALEAEDVFLKCDRNLIVQAIRALLDNALKFSEKEVKLRAFESNSGIFIEVEDHGIGIEADQLEKITQRFYKEYKARRPRGLFLQLGFPNLLI